LEKTLSTRAIIWFKNNDDYPDGNEQGTWVYSHDGGDPSFVLKDLLEAHERARTPRQSKVWPDSFYDDSWKIGRPGYSASMLCGVDPPNFQVDTHFLTSGGQFYGDIEWLYLVTSEIVEKTWTWSVEVRIPKPSFWDRPTLANTRVKHRRRPIGALVRDLEKKTTRRKKESSSVPAS
jgi:hypothetical protein